MPRALHRAVAVATAAGVVAATAITGGGPAAAARGHDGTVKAEDARFQVLSPTLIRTEYAGDGKFVDAATFNVIGRDSFSPPRFTSTTSKGWLTIKTSALTLRYRLNSGPFSPRNLVVDLKAGDTPVTATPWRPLTCDVGALCEVEDQSYSGLAPAADHGGYTGSGFLAGFEGAGNSLTAQVNVATAGMYRFAIRYSNAVGGDQQHTTRTLSLSVDGGAGPQVTLPPTPNWDTWSIATADMRLAAGRHTIALTRTAEDSGHVNVDSVAVTAPDAGYPPTSATAITDCRYGVSCEAEAARIGGSAHVATDHRGYAGKGFLGEVHQGSSLTTHLVEVPADGTYSLHVRYANGVGGDNLHQTRTATVTVGDDTRTLSFPATDDWDTWATMTAPIDLKAGANDITIGCPEAASCHINPDTIAVTAAGAPAPPPHLALGGYRRSLDGVDGERGDPPATPGLLHRDGWYLLDDTPSALFTPGSTKVSPRPGHEGAPYQDGYVFGYGQDYKRGLSDLATLTGPPALLPRWAYGVWYSQYFDRTAADYRDRILPRFRSEGVPLDVLVVDTDFKSPNAWSGWDIDRTKFPDPKGFFDWAESQGLRNVLNIHPSILAEDPKFAQAQATAKGKLRKVGCPGGPECYVFDWGDPDQLKAYLDLHTSMEQQGNDFWWLDWCCDAAQSSQAGVTPDAWINYQYAARTDRLIGRGFVISRAYGSLQSGPYGGPSGLPTGPWAEKRSTLHFTGDSTGSWGTLRYIVGATPGESAATGMASISHDIGGHNDPGNLQGSETYKVGDETRHTTKLPDDLYARWVQLATFQPIDRLHSNHGDRLPWQYGPEANASANKFLNLRERLVPYTYTLAKQATATGVPIVRPMYLEYPAEEKAYTTAATQYLYGPDILVAPVTTPGTSATTTVWFPPGEWTDYFTGQTYAGGTTHTITGGLDTMPVFIRSGGILLTRTDDVANDVQNPLTKVTLTIGAGASGSFTLHEDDGAPIKRLRSATTKIDYTRSGPTNTVKIHPTRGSYRGQVTTREWTLTFHNATQPTTITANGTRLRPDAYTWDAPTHTLTVKLPRHDIHKALTVTYR
ncbi:TIM-barrel domain-containing protein [Thermopolyspora sp. NPDC052614]|uniref:TIM-barrel domain-containing protein n=1 Tax=Thermopolyspora sp. NPDC052614 TaxID=3155682 RepID=UPI003423FF54